MTLLSGNPDGFSITKDKKREQQINDLLLSGYEMNSKNRYFPIYKEQKHTT